jgi:biopolymer transport protein ExbB
MLNHRTSNQKLLVYAMFAMALMLAAAIGPARHFAHAQDPSGGPSAAPPPAIPAGASSAPAGNTAPAEPKPEVEGINLFSLLLKGGIFMIPIGLLSLLASAFVIERFLALRRDRVLPEGLVAGLGRLGSGQGGFDPRQAYRLCQQFPSAAATVIRAMLLKVGRPHSEVEHAVSEASEREAERLYGNVRWLTLTAAVAPLMGLLGTVWGMIRAFHDTTALNPGQNKADFLAKGIYEALVTTLGGLLVAIPAAIIAHYFEGKIQSLFHQIDELLFNLLPQIERYEGRVRFSRQLGESEDGPRERPVDGQPAEARAPVPK